MLNRLFQSWEKNWPEIRCAMTGSLPSFLFKRHPQPLGHAIPVFCYHSVDKDDFHQDLVFLRNNGYRTIGADTLLTFMKNEHSCDQPAVVLTFDDCPVSLYRIALPLLVEFGYQATAFAAPLFHELASHFGEASERPCTWAELRESEQSGALDIQSHSYAHRYFPRWPEAVPLCSAGKELHRHIAAQPVLTIEEDLTLAKKTLELQLRKTVRHLAFPMYNGTTEAITIGRKLGYEGFWWGVYPGRPINRPGDAVDTIVRISGEFLRRLPGKDRVSLSAILVARYSRSFRKMAQTRSS